MKKIITILLALIMVFSLAACGSKTPSSNNSSAASSGEGGSEQSDANVIEFGDYKAVYKGGELTKTDDGTDAIILTFDYTNGSSDLKSFGWSYYYEPKQAGEELSTAIIYTNEEQTESVSDSEYVQAEAGATMEIKLAYELVNLTDDVTIDFSDLYDEHAATLTISLADCTQAE